MTAPLPPLPKTAAFGIPWKVSGTPAAPPTTAPAYTNPTSPGVSLSSTNPTSSLLGQTIGVGPTANRMDIANTYEQNWNNQTAPQYQADLRGATSQAAGAGQLGSGQLRTSLGNLAYNRDVQRQGQESNFLNTALNGTIGDAYNNVGIAQQQQGFQAGLQNQGFQQGLQSLAAGSTGNPSSAQLGLSGVYGQQAQGGQQAVGGAIQNANNQAYQQQILRLIGGGQPASTSTVPASGGSSPLYGSLGNAGSYVGNGVNY